jgi:hypothetical protein
MNPAPSGRSCGAVRAHNPVERLVNKIEQCRYVATRYDKLAANCLAFVH